MRHLLDPQPTDPITHPDRSFPRRVLRWVADEVRPIAPASRIGRILIIGPVLVALLLLAIVAYLADGSASAAWLFGYLYNVLPALALAGLVSLTSRRTTKGMPVVAVGTAVFTAFNLYALIPMFVDDSSTGVLLFLFLPLYTGAFVILTALVAWLVHVLRHRGGHLTDSLPR